MVGDVRRRVKKPSKKVCCTERPRSRIESPYVVRSQSFSALELRSSAHCVRDARRVAGGLPTSSSHPNQWADFP